MVLKINQFTMTNTKVFSVNWEVSW